MENNLLITVKNRYKSTKFSINTDLFDSNIEMMVLEAATRFVEKYKKDNDFLRKFNPKFKCFVSINNKNYEYQINSYYALINAGLFRYAELLKEKIKQTFDLDISNINKVIASKPLPKPPSKISKESK